MTPLLKDPASHAAWVYGQPMAPCPKCGSYNMKPQIPASYEPDKPLITRAIKDGHDVPGARIVRKDRLTIK